MPLTVLSHSCDNGPCPTFYKAPGGVVIQGLKTNDPEHLPPGIPDHEGVLFIPDASWDILMANLPGRP
jgi:hypothetical protein